MDFSLPPVGEGLFEVELVRWLVKPGEAVGRGQSLMEVMSDKATMEVPAAFAGTVTETLPAEGTKIKVGELVLRYEPGEGSPAAEPARGPAAAVAAEVPTRSPVRTSNGHATAVAEAPPGTLPAAAPSVRLLARKLGVDLARVQGSGPAGRILHEDLAGFLAPKARNEQPKPPTKSDAAMLDLGKAGTRFRLLGLRRKIAEHMIASTRSIPHYAYIDECDLTDLVRLRTQLKEIYAKAGVKLTYLPFIVKAVARALKEVPLVNATFHEAEGEMVLHEHYHIGVAVATPQGLIVPVVKDADKKDVAAIATEIDRLSADARSGKIKLEDLKGGTFTVTSIGGIGGLISTPIINHPEVGIVGVGKVVKRPIYDNHGNLKPVDLLYLSFSFDHRVVDGAIGAVFGNAVIRHLQNPASLLLPERFAT